LLLRLAFEHGLNGFVREVAEYVATSTPVEKIGSTNLRASPISIHPGPAS
jgi:hypothetical protein